MSTIRKEQAVSVFGVFARALEVLGEDAPGHITNQVIQASRTYEEGDVTCKITVKLRFDDQCKNGHETFSITGDIYALVNGRWRECSSGCIHKEIAQQFPELAHLIKWHLVSTDGPMHYIANTLYHAGNLDAYGLRKGETRQIRNGRTGELCWKLEAVNTGPGLFKSPPSDPKVETIPLYLLVDSGECPVAPVAPALKWVPWNRVGEGKDRHLELARLSAAWPEATDEELMQEAEELKKALLARLPVLMEEFKKTMLSVGFVWPEWLEEEEEK